MPAGSRIGDYRQQLGQSFGLVDESLCLTAGSLKEVATVLGDLEKPVAIFTEEAVPLGKQPMSIDVPGVYLTLRPVPDLLREVTIAAVQTLRDPG